MDDVTNKTYNERMPYLRPWVDMQDVLMEQSILQVTGSATIDSGAGEGDPGVFEPIDPDTGQPIP